MSFITYSEGVKMRTIKFTKFTRIFILLGCMLLLPAMKTSAANPEWMFFQHSTFNVRAVKFSDDGENMWVGMAGIGIYKFHKETQKFIDSIPVAFGDFARDNDGVFWICSNGLVKFDGVNQTVYNKSNSGMPENYTYKIQIDRKGNKWLATEDGGLLKFNGVNWTVYNTKNSKIPSNMIFSIAIDKNDKVWVASGNGGLAYLDDENNWIVFDKDNSGLPTNYLFDLVFDKTGNLWIASNSGLVKYDGINWVVFNKSNSLLPDTVISSIAVDSSNNVWFGSHINYHGYGLVKFNGIDTFTVYNTSNSDIEGNGIEVISVDKVNNIWIGVVSDVTFKMGFNIFKEGGVILSAVEDTNIINSKHSYIYPNPVNDKFQIMNYVFWDYSVTNLTGQVLLSGKTFNNEIDVRNLQSGIYFICLKDGINTKYLKFLKK